MISGIKVDSCIHLRFVRLSLPGCISEGDDVDNALHNIQEAIELHPEPVEDEGFNLEGVLVRELVL